MGKDAQFALRRMMEKFIKETRFCITCNYIMKIIPAIQSRCLRFRFTPIEKKYCSDRLRNIIMHENISIDEGGIQAVIKLGRGDMRHTLNILQYTHMVVNTVSEETVYVCTGNPRMLEIKMIFSWLL